MADKILLIIFIALGALGAGGVGFMMWDMTTRQLWPPSPGMPRMPPETEWEDE